MQSPATEMKSQLLLMALSWIASLIWKGHYPTVALNAMQAKCENVPKAKWSLSEETKIANFNINWFLMWYAVTGLSTLQQLPYPK